MRWNDRLDDGEWVGQDDEMGSGRSGTAACFSCARITMTMLQFENGQFKEIVAKKEGGSFQYLDPTKREEALLILSQTSDFFVYLERSVWKLNLKTPSYESYVLVGSVCYADIAPKAYRNVATDTLCVGCDDLLWVVDTKRGKEVLTLQGWGGFNALVANAEELVATFDAGLFVLNANGEVIFQYQNPGAERFIHAEKRTNSREVTVELEDGSYMAVDMDAKTSRKLS
jgi:hypothetical protein